MDWNDYIKSFARTAARKFDTLCNARQFSPPESILYLYKSTIFLCTGYCCEIWLGAFAMYFQGIILNE